MTVRYIILAISFILMLLSPTFPRLYDKIKGNPKEVIYTRWQADVRNIKECLCIYVMILIFIWALFFTFVG